MTFFVLGTGAWMPGRPNVDAVLGDAGSLGPEAPACAGAPPRLLRATSLLTRMCFDAATQAATESGFDPSQLFVVSGSANGETTTAVEQLSMMVSGDGRLSPAKFKNCVNNASAAVWSIAQRNRRSSTSVAAGGVTVAHALLEAQLLVLENNQPALVVVGDDQLPEPFRGHANFAPFAAAIVIASAPKPRSACVGLGVVRATAAAGDMLPLSVVQHPCRGAYRLLRSIAARETTEVDLGRERGESWSVAVKGTL